MSKLQSLLTKVCSLEENRINSSLDNKLIHYSVFRLYNYTDVCVYNGAGYPTESLVANYNQVKGSLYAFEDKTTLAFYLNEYWSNFIVTPKGSYILLNRAEYGISWFCVGQEFKY